MPWSLLFATSLGMFAAAASGAVRSPFLIDIARDLGSSVAVVANVLSVISVAWAVSAAVAGPASDRWGRRPFLIGGPLALGLASLGVATADGVVELIAWVFVGGLCCGAYTGPTFAEVSARVAASQQGRAMGWVMSGQSLTLLIGVPLAAWFGARVGWRGVSVGMAVLALAATTALIVATQRRAHAEPEVRRRSPPMRDAFSPTVLRLLIMGVADRLSYGLVVLFFATFLQMVYGMSVDQVAGPLVVFAVGNILGTVLGGQLADRLGRRMAIFAVSMVLSGIAGLALFSWQTGPVVSIALGFVYIFVNALARPSLMATLGGMPAHVRGTVMSWNVTCSSLGWLGASGLGGWMIATQGFDAFGPLALIIAVTGALPALWDIRR